MSFQFFGIGLALMIPVLAWINTGVDDPSIDEFWEWYAWHTSQSTQTGAQSGNYNDRVNVGVNSQKDTTAAIGIVDDRYDPELAGWLGLEYV